MNFKIAGILIFILSIAPAITVFAQVSEYQMANRLMQQQNYEEALPIFEELYRGNPRSYVFFDQYTACLINLKMFDQAEEVTREQIRDDRYRLQSSLKLAEILHLRGNRDEALEIWRELIVSNRNNVQAYFTIGAAKIERQEFDAAIELYENARNYFGDETLFLNELANTYMQAGRFEESVNQYFRLIIHAPDQMSLVQQRFLRMRDHNLYQIAALELEDQLLELDINHRAYSPMYQLLSWLLLETEEYRRAFVFARQYENRTGYTIYSLFSLANQLVSARQFDLAVQSYNYYLENGDESIQLRAMEELAAAYVQWVQYLKQNNLETDSRHNELNSKALALNEELLKTAPYYERADRIFSRIIDLAIDHYKDIEKAEYWFDEMKNSPAEIDEAYAYYAEGRIAMFKKDFVRARQTLTRADRATEHSNLSEQARYYLSLSDFFAGDFEFAEIQLRTLERRQTSYYANNAIKLRMWIKNGLRADSTGSILQTISASEYAIHTGNYLEALNQLEPVFANTRNLFADDMTVLLSSELPSEFSHIKFLLLNRAIESRHDSPLLERMMWDRGVLAEEIHKRGGFQISEDSLNMYEFLNQYKNRLMTNEDTPFFGSENLFDFDRQYISDLFEELILTFPDGFYAPFAREKIRSEEFSNQILP